MIELKPFTEIDFETLKSWVSSKEELFQFAGPIFSYPLTNSQLLSYLNMKDKQPFKVVLKSSGESIGHCELNFQDGDHRLSRILVGKKEHRGKKLGEQIVRKMAALFFQDLTVNEVNLNTFDWNKAAIKCYKKVGFKINHNKSEYMVVNGNSWKKINMVLKRDCFDASKNNQNNIQ